MATKSIEETAAVWYRGFTAIVDGFYIPRIEDPKTTVDAKGRRELTYQAATIREAYKGGEGEKMDARHL